MQNNNGLNGTALISKTKIYLIIIAVLLVVICIFNYKLIPIAVVGYGLILSYSIWAANKRKAELSKELEDLTLKVGSTAKTTLINSPFPLAIVDTTGNVIWRSEKFVSVFADVDMNAIVSDLTDRIKKNVIDESKQKGDIKTETIIKDKNFQILGSYVRVARDTRKKAKNKKREKLDTVAENTVENEENDEYTMILYFIDETENRELKEEVENSELSIGIIMIDNYEEVAQRVPAEMKPVFVASIEKTIYDWASSYNILLIKSDRDTFYGIASRKYIDAVTENKVDILNEIKKIDLPEGTQATLSVVFSNDGATNIEKAESAKAVMDIALGRGGDQAIIKQDGKYQFFGGRTIEVEKRTRVKARMISHALQKLIEESDNVLLMGHSHSDMDALGACLGIYRFATALGKEAKIVNNSLGTGIDKFVETVKANEEYENIFIDSQEALGFATENSLMVICDTSKKTYVDAPELLDKVSKKVIIDHHRRSTDYIEDAILTFQEVYASSACELVTEILEYANIKFELSEIEMDALYAGIMLDTKNFTFKTGVRTFEAAAYLRKCGVDIIRVKKWFQSDLTTYQTIADIVSKAEVMNDNIAISIYENEEDSNANIIAAKAADELLTIGGISASFVLTEMEDKIYISGRSAGEVNVQLILEKLGGGGHITLAGAQMENISIDDAKQELINRINEYFFEIEA